MPEKKKNAPAPPHLAPVLTAAEWQMKLNTLVPQFPQGGAKLVDGLRLWDAARASFGDSDWRTLLTFLLIIMAAAKSDPAWDALPALGDVVRQLNSEAVQGAVPVLCHTCQRTIAEPLVNIYQGEPLCQMCSRKLPPNDKASLKTRPFWR